VKWLRRFRRRLRLLYWAWRHPLSPAGHETLIVGITYSKDLTEDPGLLSFIVGLDAKTTATRAIKSRYPERPTAFPLEGVVR
jgi:hypothetical protein